MNQFITRAYNQFKINKNGANLKENLNLKLRIYMLEEQNNNNQQNAIASSGFILNETDFFANLVK